MHAYMHVCMYVCTYVFLCEICVYLFLCVIYVSKHVCIYLATPTPARCRLPSTKCNVNASIPSKQSFVFWLLRFVCDTIYPSSMRVTAVVAAHTFRVANGNCSGLNVCVCMSCLPTGLKCHESNF